MISGDTVSHFSFPSCISAANGVMMTMVVTVGISGLVEAVMGTIFRTCQPLYRIIPLPCYSHPYFPQNTLHLRSRRENIRSSAVYGVSRTPGPTSRRTSPRRVPQGLPRTPKTLPRTAPRRSPRLNISRTRHNTGRNISTASPGLSAAFRSPYRSSLRLATNTTATPTRWSKVSFLIWGAVLLLPVTRGGMRTWNHGMHIWIVWLGTSIVVAPFLLVGGSYEVLTSEVYIYNIIFYFGSFSDVGHGREIFNCAPGTSFAFSSPFIPDPHLSHTLTSPSSHLVSSSVIPSSELHLSF